MVIYKIKFYCIIFFYARGIYSFYFSIVSWLQVPIYYYQYLFCGLKCPRWNYSKFLQGYIWVCLWHWATFHVNLYFFLLGLTSLIFQGTLVVFIGEWIQVPRSGSSLCLLTMDTIGPRLGTERAREYVVKTQKCSYIYPSLYFYMCLSTYTSKNHEFILLSPMLI